MDRLIAPNSVPLSSADTAPVSGTPQYATDGNPAAGIPATQWPAYQYNAIQEELMAILTKAGIIPDRTQLGQIAEAIPLLCPGRLIKKDRVGNDTTAALAFSFEKPAGATKARIRLAGGGGSGAGSLAPGASACSTGSGGATGSYVFDVVYDVTGSTALTGTLGHGGQISTGVGQNGGASTLAGTGFSISCPGGNGGSVKQDATSVVFDVSAQSNGGGLPSFTGTAPLYLGMLGGGVPGMCGYLFGGAVVSGQGASCPPFGCGGTNTNGGNGGNAQDYVAGGGGAAAPAGSGDVTGGIGGGGYVEVEWLS